MQDRAPSGYCRTHPQRPAHVICPECGRKCCVFCWHPNLERCEICLRQDPAAAVPPVPWENAGLGFGRRLLRTLGAAAAPLATAPAFARPVVFTSVRFALLTALPLSLLTGIVPYGSTLLEEPRSVPAAEVLLDIALTTAVRLGLDVVHLIAIALPFVSLVKAYGGADKGPYATRVILYRAWLIPASTLMGELALWGQEGTQFLLLVHLIMQVLFMLSLGFAARLACGLSAFWSITTVTVAVAVVFCVDTVALTAVTHLLPALPPPPPPGDGELGMMLNL